MRDKLFSSRKGRSLRMRILSLESLGKFQPLTARNHIAYVGNRDVAHLRNFVSYFDMMSITQPGNEGLARSVQASYLGRIRGGIKPRIVSATATPPTVINNSVSSYYKNMSFRDFHIKFSHLYRGRFKGRGTYMKHMSMRWRKLKNGIIE